ncbi:metallophosphoesterase [Deinococcus sp. Leaf326]|uniref:metallophosphoesterase family protein n=1 Tax=Deinococcus sp. Leaf326 TaxID=1736338 RepID=UPI0006FFA341|nr:metallophosphoesterase [Deinococcus sp. Leaf326]KQR04732.1 metallophosphoesterase [Deinococcus sp. Leaf326]
MRRLLPVLLPALLWGPVQATAAQPSSPAQLWLVLLSDFNGPYGSTRYPPALERVLSRVLNEWKPALVLSAGDLIAGQKASQSSADVRAMWAAFERDVRGPLAGAGIPFAFALGNHDAGLARDRREAAVYWGAHPPALNYAERSAFPFRYSFTQGPLFVAVLDASGPGVDAGQRGWLAAQLATPTARTAAVRLVLGHLPLAGLSREKNRPGEVIRPADALALRRVMERGGVTAYVSGHHAAYYPGRMGGLNVLSSGGIGGRDYVGAPGTARSVVTVLDVVGSEVRLVAYDADTGAAIPAARLPTRVDGLGGPVVRVETLR